MEPKGTGAIDYLPELRRIPLPRTRVNSSFRRCLGLAGYRSPGHHSQSRRVAHSTNTTHQYIANPMRTSPSKAITPLSDVPNEAYPRTMSGSLSVGKASAKIERRTSENPQKAKFAEFLFHALG
jgi:hypothetical protein